MLPGIDPANVGTDTFTAGVSRLRGAEYGDNLTGNNGDNVLEGQGGNDVLGGNGGDDVLTGGTGSDRFSYALASPGTSGGNDVIADFGRGQGAFSHDEGDRIDLRSASIGSFGALTLERGTVTLLNGFYSSFTLDAAAGTDTRITTAAGGGFFGGSLILQGVLPSQLQARDFVFTGQVVVTAHDPGRLRLQHAV